VPSIAVFSGGLNNHGGGGPSDQPRDTAITFRVQFKDPDGNPVDVDNPTALITREGAAQTLNALGTSADSALRYGLLCAGATGLYKLTFLTTGMQPGYFRVAFDGDWTDADGTVRDLRVEGDFAIGNVSRVQDWMRRVELGLMDDDPKLYQLDEPIPQWTADQIYSYLRDAVDRVNTFPPRLTTYDFDTLPNDHLAIMGARVYALQARARFEKANEMSYSDGHNLDIKRADFYASLAATLYQQWEAEVTSFKKMTPPTPIGLKGQQLPFRISRILGLLPNFRTLFSG
jgi:hypothetical protein